MRITNAQYRDAAKRIHESEGEIEIDDKAKVSRGDDTGAYVQAWVWVPNDSIRVSAKQTIADRTPDRQIENWYVAALSEREARALIGHIEGTMQHGLVRSYPLLPKAAQDILRAEYDKLTCKDAPETRAAELLRTDGMVLDAASEDCTPDW